MATNFNFFESTKVRYVGSPPTGRGLLQALEVLGKQNLFEMMLSAPLTDEARTAGLLGWLDSVAEAYRANKDQPFFSNPNSKEMKEFFALLMNLRDGLRHGCIWLIVENKIDALHAGSTNLLVLLHNSGLESAIQNLVTFLEGIKDISSQVDLNEYLKKQPFEGSKEAFATLRDLVKKSELYDQTLNLGSTPTGPNPVPNLNNDRAFSARLIQLGDLQGEMHVKQIISYYCQKLSRLNLDTDSGLLEARYNLAGLSELLYRIYNVQDKNWESNGKQNQRIQIQIAFRSLGLDQNPWAQLLKDRGDLNHGKPVWSKDSIIELKASIAFQHFCDKRIYPEVSQQAPYLLPREPRRKDVETKATEAEHLARVREQEEAKEAAARAEAEEAAARAREAEHEELRKREAQAAEKAKERGRPPGGDRDRRDSSPDNDRGGGVSPTHDDAGRSRSRSRGRS